MNDREAAFHHAGHAVATYVSTYHVIAAAVHVDAYGSGEIMAALSRAKLSAAGKAPSVESRIDPEVAAGIALILCAGLACERLAAERGVEIEVDPDKSAGDFELARKELRLAGLADDTASYESAAGELLADRWTLVQSFAEALLAARRLEPPDIHRLLGH